jgi:quinolinate synthase
MDGSTMEANRNGQLESLREKIRNLKDQKKAIVLAHNYQRSEVQEIADICGDSLELSMKASETDAEVIVFCGVHFMAETAAILSPQKKVVVPVLSAGCPLANMITRAQLKKKREEMPEAVVISYVNTTAEVKAESDICCTSANAVQVVESVEPRTPILMTPDRNLAMYTKKRTNRDIRWWDGYCPVHNNLTAEQVKRVKEAHPHACFLAHPECRPEVLDLADEIKSTSGMISFASGSKHEAFIIGTETGILYPLAKAAPGKKFFPADARMVCPDMKKTRLEDVLRALEMLEPEVKVPEETGKRAKKAVERMLAIPGR